jgi:hypothetical protein
VAGVCHLAVDQLAWWCGCGTDDRGVQQCDSTCTKPDHECQNRYIQWHVACCGGDIQNVAPETHGTCTQSAMMVLEDVLDPASLDVKFEQCLIARQGDLDFQQGHNGLGDNDDAIAAMCTMAWESIFDLINNPDYNECDWLIYIQNTVRALRGV